MTHTQRVRFMYRSTDGLNPGNKGQVLLVGSKTVASFGEKRDYNDISCVLCT